MKKAKILIVDDVEIVCVAMNEELNNGGFTSRFALTSAEAVGMVKKEHFDIVYVDLIMPDIDGVELCKEIKKISPKTEVVLMSGQPNADKVMDFINAGGREMFLYKPFLEGELLDVTNSVIRGKFARGE